MSDHAFEITGYAAAIVLGLAFWAAIFTKAGYSGWCALLLLVPFVNLIWLLVFALREWPIHKEIAALRSQRNVGELNYGEPTPQNADNDVTPLHAAALKGYEDVAKMPIEHGADVNAQTNNGHTPLALAIERGHDGVAALLRQSGGFE